MIRKLLLAGGVLAAVTVAVCAGLGWWAYLKFTGPMWEPGDVAGVAVLETPAGGDEGGAWVVQRGMRLHHFERGTGPPVLFVHGGPGFPTRTPMPWLETLYGSHTVHFYDQRGCGESTRPFDRFSSPNYYANMTQLEATLGLGAQIADIERIRRLLGEEKLVLIGHSFGGFLAALYAAEFPGHVAKLVLLAPADMLTMPTEGDDLFALVRDRLPGEKIAAYDAFLSEYLDFGALFRHDEAELARRNLRLGNYILEAMGRTPQAVPDSPVTLDAGGWMVYAMYLSMGRRHDYADAMAAVTAPTLVFHGDRDLQSDAAAARYARLIADAELVRVAGADHFFTADLPGLAGRVHAFLNDGQ